MNYKIEFASVPWETPMTGVRHKAMKQGDKQLRLVEYSKDMEPHWCEKGHIGYILEGQFEITFENERLVYNPGDGVFIPSGAEHRHSGRVLSEFVRVVFVEDA
jgi:quercetin dioxygenase-like cupin family protein